MREKELFPTIFADYSKHKVPDASGVEVVIEIHIQDISSINELTSEFDIDLMFSEVSTTIYTLHTDSFLLFRCAPRSMYSLNLIRNSQVFCGR